MKFSLGSSTVASLYVICCSVYRTRPCEAFLPSSSRDHTTARPSSARRNKVLSLQAVPSWEHLQRTLPNFRHEQPVAINGASYSKRPLPSSSSVPTLYRERHGWCPYSERVWLALETKQIEYDTVYIDNIYGRPRWYSGDTPQMMWEDGCLQSESMDLVQEVDKRYKSGPSLYPEDIKNDVINKVRAFSSIFPRGARPSSRAAFLFSFNGEPLWKSQFEKVLSDTNELLSETAGPFFCGEQFTAADVAWAPFLERYAAQLPCLHDGLDPKHDVKFYPHLVAWYRAMEEQVPEYACRVRGDESSWRKVLSMAGYGNAGLPPMVSSRMDDATARERKPLDEVDKMKQQQIWNQYASSSRPYVASTPSMEAASVIIRNHNLIAMDVTKRIDSGNAMKFDLPSNEDSLDLAMRSLATLLCEDRFDEETRSECENMEYVGSLAAFLDDRMCVPRDMGSLSAAYIKRLSTY